MIEKPSESEYAPFYAGYIARVPAGDVLEILERQSSTFRHTLAVAHRAATPHKEGWKGENSA